MNPICAGSHLSHRLFCAYMQGGRRWPQLRGGINIFLINEIFRAQEPSREVQDFANTQFTEDQVRKIKFVMNQDHARAGVILPNEGSSSLVINEWKKAKSSALYSLYHYILGPPLVPEKLSALNYETIAYQDEVIGYFKGNRNFEQLLKISSVAYGTMLKHHDLSQLYTLANFSPAEKEHEYLRRRDFYDSTLIKYQITLSIVEDAHTVKAACCQTITDLLEQNLKPYESVQNTQWIRWGFSLKRKDQHDSTS